MLVLTGIESGVDCIFHSCTPFVFSTGKRCICEIKEANIRPIKYAVSGAMTLH